MARRNVTTGLNMKRLQSVELIMSVLAVYLFLPLNSESYGQSSANQIASSYPKAKSETIADTYAPVGPSGYKILIPEIKMNQISGDTKPKPPVVVPPVVVPPVSTITESASDEFVEKETPAQPSEPLEQPKVEESHGSATLLPFDLHNLIPEIPVDKEDLLRGFLIALICILTGATGLAANDSYVVIKNKNGVTRVIKAGQKTPSTIAGPFKTKEVAKRAKETEYQKAAAWSVFSVSDHQDHISGSNGLADSTDCNMNLVRNRDDNCAVIEDSGRLVDAFGQVLFHQNYQTLSWKAPECLSIGQRQQQVIKFLGSKYPGSISLQDIQKELGANGMRVLLSRMYKAKLILRTGRGMYSLSTTISVQPKAS